VRGWLMLARLELELGRVAAARAALSEATTRAMLVQRPGLTDYERELLQAPPAVVRDLERALIEHADRSRGRFRTFLLTALQQYTAEAHRKRNFRKAKPKGSLLSLDELNAAQMPEAPAEFSPEDSFHYAWAAQLLDQLLKEVEGKCRADGKAVHWQVFQDKVLSPIVNGTNAPSMEEICRRFNIESPGKASNMIVTVNRRFRAALSRHIRRSVAQDSEVDEEFRELVEIFAKGGAR